MSEEKAKQGEVLPAGQDSVRLVEAIGEIAKPFAQSQTDVAKFNADLQMNVHRENTRQLELRLGADARTSWQEFSVIGFVLAIFAAILGFGLWRENATLTSSAISGILGFVGGIGLGRAKKPPN